MSLRDGRIMEKEGLCNDNGTVVVDVMAGGGEGAFVSTNERHLW